MKENVSDFDILARGSFIDNGTGGVPCMVEAITIRLNHIALGEYLWQNPSPPECYKTDTEWERHKAVKEQARAEWKKTIASRLSLPEGKGGVSVTEAESEVFTVV
jgi:hypothetical protein